MSQTPSVAVEPSPKETAIAGSGRYDLVVMATHGRTGLSRFWLGSMADELVRQDDR